MPIAVLIHEAGTATQFLTLSRKRTLNVPIRTPGRRAARANWVSSVDVLGRMPNECVAVCPSPKWHHSPLQVVQTYECPENLSGRMTDVRGVEVTDHLHNRLASRRDRAHVPPEGIGWARDYRQSP